jgi:hypothetical protein
MAQTDVCLIQVHDHKMTNSVFIILKFSTYCHNTKLVYTIQTNSYFFTILCYKLGKWPITVHHSATVMT